MTRLLLSAVLALSQLAPAGPSRPAAQTVPVARAGAVSPEGDSAAPGAPGASAQRTGEPAPSPAAHAAPEPAAPSDGTSPDESAPARPIAPRLRAVASWYATGPDGIAAAGPALRSLLGPHWRGRRILVTAGGVSAVVMVGDWCQCYRGTPSEIAVDLPAGVFARLAPLSRGITAVVIEAMP